MCRALPFRNKFQLQNAFSRLWKPVQMSVPAQGSFWSFSVSGHLAGSNNPGRQTQKLLACIILQFWRMRLETSYVLWFTGFNHNMIHSQWYLLLARNARWLVRLPMLLLVSKSWSTVHVAATGNTEYPSTRSFWVLYACCGGHGWCLWTHQHISFIQVTLPSVCPCNMSGSLDLEETLSLTPNSLSTRVVLIPPLS